MSSEHTNPCTDWIHIRLSIRASKQLTELATMRHSKLYSKTILNLILQHFIYCNQIIYRQLSHILPWWVGSVVTDIKSKKLQSYFTCQASQILNITLPPQYIQLQSHNCLLFQLVFLQGFREHPLPFAANQCNSLPTRIQFLCVLHPQRAGFQAAISQWPHMCLQWPTGLVNWSLCWRSIKLYYWAQLSVRY